LEEISLPNQECSSCIVTALTEKKSLAYAEIYLALAHIVRRFDFAPYDTTVANVSVLRELGIGYPKEGRFGVRATVSAIVEE
jgi:hypothetical protein